MNFCLFVFVGAGTFGRVFLVQNVKNEEYFAMKVLKIKEVIKMNQVEHVINERKIMMHCDCPFFVRW